MAWQAAAQDETTRNRMAYESVVCLVVLVFVCHKTGRAMQGVPGVALARDRDEPKGFYDSSMHVTQYPMLRLLGMLGWNPSSGGGSKSREPLGWAILGPKVTQKFSTFLFPGNSLCPCRTTAKCFIVRDLQKRFMDGGGDRPQIKNSRCSFLSPQESKVPNTPVVGLYPLL